MGKYDKYLVEYDVAKEKLNKEISKLKKSKDSESKRIISMFENYRDSTEKILQLITQKDYGKVANIVVPNELIEFLDSKVSDGTIYHGCHIVKYELLLKFIGEYPEFEWLLIKPKSWKLFLAAYTLINPNLENWTKLKDSRFDTMKRFEDGTVKRTFRFYFK